MLKLKELLLINQKDRVKKINQRDKRNSLSRKNGRNQKLLGTCHCIGLNTKIALHYKGNLPFSQFSAYIYLWI
jgi:hypothetical protein